MSKQLPEIKSPADLVAFFQAWGTQHQLALNGILDKVPEPLKAEWQSLKDGLNTILLKLKPTDQVPAAMDAAYALNSFARTVSDLMEYTDMLRDRLTNMGQDLAKRVTAVQGFESQIADGTLMHKDKFTPLIESAKANGIKETMALVQGTRKTLIALAGLPEAPEATLCLDVPAFEAAVNQAKENVKKLAEKGLTLANKGKAWVQELAWQPATAFQGQMTKIEDLVGGKFGAAPAKPAGDLLLGGAASGGVDASKDQSEEAPAKKFVMA